jgi:GDP-L-fucose synthase
VIPALIRRFHEAKLGNLDKVVIWGTGAPRREFLYVDDMADASVHVMDLDRTTYDAHTTPTLSHINVGTDEDITICELANLISQIIGYHGKIEFDAKRPDGSPRKLMCSAKLSLLGWAPKIQLFEGIMKTYEQFQSTQNTAQS